MPASVMFRADIWSELRYERERKRQFSTGVRVAEDDIGKGVAKLVSPKESLQTGDFSKEYRYRNGRSSKHT